MTRQRLTRALFCFGSLSLFAAPLGCESDPGLFDATTASSGASSGAGGESGTGGAATTSVGQGGSASAATSGSGGSGGAGLPSNNGFPPKWNDGTNCGQEEDVQVWAYSDDTYILRQSLCSNYEAPFVYLFLGQDMALVQDTGTGAVNLYNAVDPIVEAWASGLGKSSFPVAVTHSHGHGDHVGGDGQFQGKSDYDVVGSSTSAVTSYFQFSDWPNDVVSLDLGDRVLDVLGIPGHQSAHVALYDRRHQLLLTGDHLYPGRLYINDWAAYQASTQRLVDFVNAGYPAAWVLGTHIELTADGFDNDFQIGSQKHPNEHVLQLDYETLVELNDAVIAMGNNPVYEPHQHFIVYP